MKVRLRGCKHCGGDIIIEDYPTFLGGGKEERCLQCGRGITIVDIRIKRANELLRNRPNRYIPR